jgi:hypothetical protein
MEQVLSDCIDLLCTFLGILFQPLFTEPVIPLHINGHLIAPRVYSNEIWVWVLHEVVPYWTIGRVDKAMSAPMRRAGWIPVCVKLAAILANECILLADSLAFNDRRFLENPVYFVLEIHNGHLQGQTTCVALLQQKVGGWCHNVAIRAMMRTINTSVGMVSPLTALFRLSQLGFNTLWHQVA